MSGRAEAWFVSASPTNCSRPDLPSIVEERHHTGSIPAFVDGRVNSRTLRTDSYRLGKAGVCNAVKTGALDFYLRFRLPHASASPLNLLALLPARPAFGPFWPWFWPQVGPEFSGRCLPDEADQR